MLGHLLMINYMETTAVLSRIIVASSAPSPPIRNSSRFDFRSSTLEHCDRWIPENRFPPNMHHPGYADDITALC
ncbi:hypothetical protein DERF_005057 [Dermatophagoides farinae]|uniref:Uncharacterized protein n=1 Tax=Dermatophagoides farinae TaxID=6954 RepID=A0A922LAT7_DERFA|nr:hypothetical protein DERF_005057 [Dermatophagoides farinae]